ncbi:serine hydrolase [Aquimarina sp. D1M17]|uniref:serine hydrolase n=1 Tax=Aquimarina acroporae TaxID=2937283 RepID=UPI0020BEBD66|nr:serine hydrolase [Aquimarina acroporae]MCK8522932.1 serine hydrolase [Aquimarina acroporae]
MKSSNSFHHHINLLSERHYILTFVLIFFSALAFNNTIWGNSKSLKPTLSAVSMYSNGTVAQAYPISNIVIDGNTSDWPKDLTRYPINKFPYGNEIKNKEDFDAYFQVGYNLEDQSIYFVVVVTDDSYIVDTSNNSDWNTQDTFNFYIDAKHSPNGSGVNLYQYGENFKDTNNQSISWDPTMKPTSWDNVKITSKREGTTTIYECKIILKNELVAGKTIGMDYVFIDKDSDDDKGSNSFIAWGDGGGKSTGPGRLGDLILMNKKQPKNAITGQLLWKNKKLKGFPSTLQITSKNNPNLWLQTKVDSLGQYTVELPTGEYSIKPSQTLFYQNEDESSDEDLFRIDVQNSSIDISITENSSVKVPDLELSVIESPQMIPNKGILHDFDPNQPSSIDNFITKYQEHFQIPGVSLALIKEGKVIYHKTYGVKNTLTKSKVDHTTLFEAASITKPVFGFAVMRLVEKGIIDLDKPLYEYLPFEDIAHDDRYKLITARHVLCHQTGFPNWAWANKDGKIDIKFTPGSKYGYSGEGFEYLKRVVVHITGKHINEILKDEVLIPLQLKNTYFSTNDVLKKVVANGHFDNMPTQVNLPGEPGMAWSMHTEAKIFTNFLLGISNRKVLQPKTYEDMFTLHTEVPKDENDSTPKDYKDYFGLGISIQKSPYGLAFGHGGNNGDFKCLALMYQDLNMGFVIFTNSNTGDRLHEDLAEYLITGKREKSK